MDNWPKVAIIVLNWNGWQDTIECLESLQRITYSNYQIIVVDNGSTDDSVEKIKAWARGEIPVESKFFEYDPSTKPVQWIEYDRATAEAGGIAEEETKLAGLPPHRRLVLIQTGQNLGFAGGNNVGIAYGLECGIDYILLLNNDAVVSRDSLRLLIKTAQRSDKIGIVGGLITYYDEPQRVWFAGGRFHWYREGIHIDYNATHACQYKGTKDTDWVTGCMMLIKRKVFEQIGALDEKFFLYGEDTDFCHRAKARGLVVKVNLDARANHKVSHSTGIHSALAFYYWTRNRLYYHRKHARSKADIMLFVTIFGTVRLMRIIQWTLKGRFDLIIATCRGMCDYLRAKMGRSLLY